jgi:hypothetical protein
MGYLHQGAVAKDYVQQRPAANRSSQLRGWPPVTAANPLRGLPSSCDGGDIMQ